MPGFFVAVRREERMTVFYAPTINYWSTTLNSTINKTVDTITLQSTTGLQYPGVIVIDREDGNGTATPNSREVVSFTGISGNDLTGCTRGFDNSDASAHSSGALVESICTAGMWNGMIDALVAEHSIGGAHSTTYVVTPDATQTLTAKTLTSPIINTQITGTAIVDEDDMASDSAVKVPTQQSVKAYADSVHDSTITFTNKTIVQKVTSYTPAGGATATLNLTTGNIHSITMPAGNITIAISNEAAGQCFLIEITQDGGGSRTVTWFTTIRWAGGSAPTLTTTASKRDVFGFRVTGTGTYDGYIVGQNI